MPSDLYWITAKLATMARPRAGDWLEDEIAHWQRSGVETVASLLEPEEMAELGLQAEAALCERHGIRFLSFPIPDRGVPADKEAARRFAAALADSGKAVAIHCRAGIGRASLMAAAVLIHNGLDPEAALSAIEQARGWPVPDTGAQWEWVVDLDER